MKKSQIYEKLNEVMDPEIGISIVELGLIYDIKMKNGEVNVLMTLTTPFCPLSAILEKQVKEKIENLDGTKKANVEFTFDPPWNTDRIPKEVRQRLGLLH